jgi:hypothetical protein
MRKHFGAVVCALLIFSVTIISWRPANKPLINLYNSSSAREIFEKYVSNVYESAHLQESGLASTVFEKAVTGFINLKIAGKLSPNCSILTIVDYAKSSCEKRMWIIDVISDELLLNTWVAHGQGSGEDMADRFSNKLDSHKSSLGFYLTDDVYYGKNGLSLKLDGLDVGFNENARTRAIVVHGADYVSQGAIDHLGYLGRSFGCPAVPTEVAEQVINTIKDKTVMFINGNDRHYTSRYLDEEMAANYLSHDSSNNVIANL